MTHRFHRLTASAVVAFALGRVLRSRDVISRLPPRWTTGKSGPAARFSVGWSPPRISSHSIEPPKCRGGTVPARGTRSSRPKLEGRGCSRLSTRILANKVIAGQVILENQSGANIQLRVESGASGARPRETREAGQLDGALQSRAQTLKKRRDHLGRAVRSQMASQLQVDRGGHGNQREKTLAR